MTATPLSAAATDAPAVLRATGLSRVFSGRAGTVMALTQASLAVAEGEFVVVRGPSGAGKTTLLNLLGGLDRPTSGTVHVRAKELTALREEEVLALRRTELSYIFQSFGLVPVLSAAENVEVPLRLLRTEASERARRVTHALELVGLGDHARQRPYELSGGQQQRVGIARALVTDPSILLADEPTGQLDSATAAMIMDLLSDLTHQRGLAAVVATHDPLMVARADRVLEIHDGQLSQAAPTSPLGDAAATEIPAPARGPETEAEPLTRAELRRRRQRL